MDNILDPKAWTPKRLQSLFDEQIAEDYRLDYKGRGALPILPVPKDQWDKKRVEIGKDVTAFANSDGGVLIYGISEKSSNGKSTPDCFEPISTAEITKDQLTQIIAGNSAPPPVGVRVIQVPIPNQSDDTKVCYVILIPKSDTAHQANDGKYYYRNEATTTFMRDWLVRDTMNRRKVPKFTVLMNKRWGMHGGIMYPTLSLKIRITNDSSVVAKDFLFTIWWPEHLQGHTISYQANCAEAPRSVLVNSRKFVFTNEEFGPFYPGRQVNFHAHMLAKAEPPTMADTPIDVTYELFADNMPRQCEKVLVQNIPCF